MGGTSRRRERGRIAADTDGFTLIELLIVVVIIGVLAAVAIPQFGSTRERAYDAAAKSDLRNLMTSQEAVFAAAGTYGTLTGPTTFGGTASLSGGDETVTLNFSEGITAGVSAAGEGYTATAAHESSTSSFCVTVNTGGATDGEIREVESGGSCGGS